MNNPFSLHGQAALVTGGASGLGLGIATCLASAGARVAIVGRREAALREATAKIGGQAVAIPGDVTEHASLERLLGEAEAAIGPLDIIVNNAGSHIKAPALELRDADFASVVDVHVTSAFLLARLAAEGMIERGRGSVVFVGSLNAIIGMPEVPAYSAAKAAVDGLVRELAVEWAADGVRVNGVRPGWINAGMAKRVLGQDHDRRAKVMSRTPMRRLGEAEEVGWAVVYLCSRAASFVTGIMLRVDGGAAIGF